MNISIVSISDWDKHFQDISNDYFKRIQAFCTLKRIKSIKYGPRHEIIAKETLLLQQAIPVWSKTILLSHRWPSRTSEDFSAYLEKHQQVTFLIWWAFGVNEEVILPSVDATLSFGKQTMPHWVVKVILLEQLWRAYTLQIWKKYHY